MPRLLPAFSVFALWLSGCNILIVDDDLYQDMVKPYEDGDQDGFTPADGDCNDEQPTIHPSAEEVCDGLDNDCNGEIDEEGAADGSTWYTDADGDGFGDATSSVQACAVPSGYTGDNKDCDDANPGVHPSAEESCNGIDDDCDGTIDQDDAVDAGTWYADTDGDGFGDANASTQSCAVPSGYVADSTDCNDAAANAYPGATEVCGDSLDNDCDGTLDEDDAADAITWYPDADSDGFGDPSDSGIQACAAPSGHVADNTDCNDAAASVHPGGIEVCDDANLDEDCNGVSDNDDSGATNLNNFYVDGDLDGYGSNNLNRQCDAASGLVASSDDCNDSNAAIHPGADEYCDGTDNDCDGTTDEDDAVDAIVRYPDFDGDGYGQDSGMTTGCSSINSVPLTDSGTSSPSGYIADHTTVTDTLSLAGCGSTYSVTVDVDITHTYRGDLEITLTSPSGTDILLWDARGSSAHDLVATFTDSVTSYNADDASGDLGSILPTNALSQLSGETSTGLWTLTVYDQGAGDQGYLNTWGVNVNCSASTPVANGGDCDESNATVYPGATDTFGDSLDNDCDGTVDNLEFVQVDTSTWSPTGVYGPRVSARPEGVYVAWATDSYQDGGTTFYDGAIVSLYDGADLASGPTGEFTLKDTSNTGTLGGSFDFAVDDTYLYLAKSIHKSTGNELVLDTLVKLNPTQQNGAVSSLIQGNLPYEDVALFLMENSNGNDYASAVGCGADGLETILGSAGAIHYDSSSAYKAADTSQGAGVCAPVLTPHTGLPYFHPYFHTYESGETYGSQYSLYPTSSTFYTTTCYHCADAYDIRHRRNNNYRASAYATSQNGTNLRVEVTGQNENIYSSNYDEISTTEDLTTIDVDVSTSGVVYVCGIGSTGYSVWAYAVDVNSGTQPTEIALTPSTGTYDQCSLSISDTDLLSIAIRSGNDIWLGTAQAP